MISRHTAAGTQVWIVDHFSVIGAATLLAQNKEEAALRIGERLLIRRCDQCFASENDAIAFELHRISRQQAAINERWASLAQRLVQQPIPQEISADETTPQEITPGMEARDA